MMGLPQLNSTIIVLILLLFSLFWKEKNHFGPNELLNSSLINCHRGYQLDVFT